MGENSKIEWTDHTTNLWWGCHKEHTGCKNCYAEELSDNRLSNNLWGKYKGRKRIKSAFKDLNHFQRKAFNEKTKRKVFVGSMMDIFEEDKPLINPFGETTRTNHLRQELFSLINEGYYNNLIFLFLTKRPTNIIEMIPYEWINNTPENVWFGTSVSDMNTWSYAESLKLVSNTNLFLSIEPQVGEIKDVDLSGFNWIIQGGESGRKRRVFDPQWAYIMQDMCKAQNVPYFFKQWDKVLKPEHDMLIREFPKQFL